MYAAIQANPKRTVALKVMNVADNAPQALRRFRREAQILARLRHPGIAQIYQAGTHTDEHGQAIPFFVMEYVPSAKNILEYAQDKQLDLRQRLKLFVRICAAVEHGHHQKVIHRDLKPANILVDQSGQPKIIDFGIAHAAQTNLSHRTQQIDTSRLVGTIQYMAPEQLTSQAFDLDARCDVYALGAVLYRLLTGRPTHDVQGKPLHVAMEMIREQHVTPPGDVNRELRGDLGAIIEKALAKDRSQRYRHAGELGRDILRYVRDEPVQARSASLTRRTRLFMRRHRAAAVAVLIAGGVFGAAAVLILASPYIADQITDAGAVTGATRTEAADAASTAGSDASMVNQSPSNEVLANRQPFVIKTCPGQINEIACHTNGLIAIACHDASVSVYDMHERTMRFTTHPDDEPAMHVAFNRAGDRVLTVTRSGLCVLLDATSGETIRAFQHSCDTIHDMALSPGGKHIALACADFVVRLFDVDGSIKTLRSTTGAITSLAFSLNGAHLLGGSQGKRLYVWDVATGRARHRIATLESGVMEAAWLDDNRSIIAVDRAGRATTWRLNKNDERSPPSDAIDVTDGLPVAVAVDSTGRWLAGASSDAVMIFDLQVMDAVGAARRHDGPLTAVGITSDGRWYLTGTLGGEVAAMPIEPRDSTDAREE